MLCSPLPPLVSCFPREGNLGKRGGRAPGVPAAVRGLSGRGRAHCSPPAWRGRCHPQGCPLPVPPSPPSNSPWPGGGDHQAAASPGEQRAGDCGDTNEGCGVWETTWAGEDPKSKHCPSQMDFPQPSILPSTQLISSQHCMAIKMINADAIRLPAPCMATRTCRKEHCCDEGTDSRLIIMSSLRLGR